MNVIHGLKRTSTELTFSDGSRDYRIQYAASGDLDHDGYGDRLIFMSARATDGIAHGHLTYCASKTKPQSRVVTIREYPQGNYVQH